MIQSVTVYCASSKKLAEIYREAATSLGRAIAQRKWVLIYGGDCNGLMGLVADGASTAGGKVIGIMPERIIKLGSAYQKCDELIPARDMRHRKEMLENRGDAFITLPGGLGTLEEFFEVLVGKQLGFHDKPIVLLNIAGYFNPLLTMIDHGIEHHFIKAGARDFFFVAGSVEQAIGYLAEYDRQ